MKLHKNLLHACVLTFIVATTFQFKTTFGQADLVKYLNAGKEDASKLTQAYLSPMVVGASYGLNAGWFNTAKAHKSLGFDLGVYLSPVFIPKSHDTFTPDELKLKTVSSVTPGAKSSTIFGPDNTTTYKLNADPSATFQGPEGLGLRDKLQVSAVIIPMVQLGIGIIKNTDLKVRYLPETKFGDTKVKILGFGVLHDVKQHIPGIKTLPFDLSVLAAFTDLKGKTDLSGKFSSGGDTSPQQADYEFKAWLFQALISKKISVLTVYGGIGYSTTKSKSDIVGSYVLDPKYNVPPLKDPVSLNYKNSSARLTAGFRLLLGVFFIDANYTLQEYSSATVGLGFAFR